MRFDRLRLKQKAEQKTKERNKKLQQNHIKNREEFLEKCRQIAHWLQDTKSSVYLEILDKKEKEKIEELVENVNVKESDGIKEMLKNKYLQGFLGGIRFAKKVPQEYVSFWLKANPEYYQRRNISDVK